MSHWILCDRRRISQTLSYINAIVYIDRHPYPCQVIEPCLLYAFSLENLYFWRYIGLTITCIFGFELILIIMYFFWFLSLSLLY
jgi:hypothetical protein